MANEWFDITCADPCTTGCPEWANTAYIQDPNCCTKTEKSQLCGLYLECIENSVPINSWTSADVLAWGTANIDNLDTTGTKVKYLVGKGGIAEPTPNESEAPKGKTRIDDYTYSLTFVIDCRDDDNGINTFMRLLQKGNTNVAFRYETVGLALYGGLNGIRPDKFYAVPTYGEGNDDLVTWTIKAEYTICVDPPRLSPNPLAS